MKIKQERTPLWQAIINQAAITLTAAGVVMLIIKEPFGIALIIVGMGLEWFKYSQRIK